MLFNSYEFLFGFLPAALLIFFLLGHRAGGLAAIGFLGVASLFFYAWWNPLYLPLLGGSIVFNFLVGRRLCASPVRTPGDRTMLWLGIAGNLSLLGYFKYAGFFAGNLNAFAGTALPVPQIVLPLGISFFTFTQIAYLVDACRKEVREYRFVHYVLFVTFFPHLLAGPILHHAEIMPQFARRETFRISAENFAVGLTIFAIGLFKKVVLADGCTEFVTPVFAAAQGGQAIGGLAAWGGALAYSFQLYFDFSGYSDMAVGLARLFGIVFPANFNSPYKATSIIDFWRRWHMTLSRFLRDYLYIALGGSRCRPVRRHANLMATMLLGGLWHGAGWTFVAWGALHGLCLVVNHAWRSFSARHLFAIAIPAGPGRWLGRLLTFLVVVVAWVLFRAESMDAAMAIFKGMAGLQGFSRHEAGWEGSREIKWLLLMFVVVWGLPNVLQMLHRFRPALETYSGEIAAPRWRRLSWGPTTAWAVMASVFFVAALINLSRVSEFLYYQF
jgi:D-alanyl-lipoteichoic acid acyltransferase DltB (MBOAT superfamily)